MMVSSIAVAAGLPSRQGGAKRRLPDTPADGLEELLGSKTTFSISEFGILIDRSPASVWRYIRYDQLATIQVGGSQRITRGEAIRFLRHGGRAAA
jgi:hypothetical protein